MARPLHLLLIGLVSLLAACQARERAGAETLPNTPESVVRQYQEWYDANDYANAKRLSTTAERARIDELQSLLEGIAQDSTLLNTKFLDIQCRSKNETAFCYCLLEDEYDRYQTLFTLHRIGEQWLVESPAADSPPDEVVDDFEELMQDVLPGDSIIEIIQ